MAIIVTALAATVACAAWHPETALTRRGSLPGVASSARGRTVAAWVQSRARSDRVVVRVSSDGGRSWSRDQTLGDQWQAVDDFSTAVRTAVSADGRIAVVWTRRQHGHSVVVIAEAGPRGRFRSPQVVSAPGRDAVDPDLAVTPSGEALVVWETRRGDERAVLRRDGKLISRRVLPLPAGGEPTVAVDPRGDRLYAWILSGVDCDNCVVATRESAAGALTRPQILSSTKAGDDADAPQVALSSARRASIVWEEGFGTDQAVIQAASAAWAGKFTAPQQLSPTPRSPRDPEAILGGGGGAGSHGVGVAASGRVSVVWVEASFRTHSRVEVVTSNASGRFGVARTLQRERGVLTYERPAIAVAPSGRILATWTLYNEDPSGSTRMEGVWGAAGSSAAAAFSPPRKLSGPNGDMSAVATTSRGGAGVAVYSDSTSGAGHVDASRWAP